MNSLSLAPALFGTPFIFFQLRSSATVFRYEAPDERTQKSIKVQMKLEEHRKRKEELFALIESGCAPDDRYPKELVALAEKLSNSSEL